MRIVLQTLERHRAAGDITDESLQLVAAVRWNLRVGVQRKPVDAGTAGAVQGRAFTLVANEPMRRTCCPARSPKAMRCWTEAARVRASSGSSSRAGS
jgi:hypothetical protein